MPDKTWSVVADKMGGHWRVVVRRGVEGQRAQLGELQFDLSDAVAARELVDNIAHVVANVAMNKTIALLDEDQLLRISPSRELVDLWVPEIHAACGESARSLVVSRFGIRLDLAKVNG